MIRNDRQLRAAQRGLDGILAGVAELEGSDREIQRELANEVMREIEEYTLIKAGLVDSFSIESLDDVGAALIKARIAAGMSQRELASELGVSEQMVQKDESRSYERAAMWRLAEVADALNLEFSGVLKRQGSIRHQSILHSEDLVFASFRGEPTSWAIITSVESESDSEVVANVVAAGEIG
jgi:transcriptional regulator with XRE-family HTH domain